ncbi:MAG: M48 family metallopeptidase [Candidatus Saccharibacteria bacterium]|nr:M48 family metallopeptidase [Candidatus Saccharibacteria bacterium]
MDANKRKTWLIMLVFLGLIAGLSVLIADLMGEVYISLYVILAALIYAFIQYFIASKMALFMAGAKPIELRDNPRFYRIVENLSISTGLPMPKVYVIDDSSPNAFATGRDPQHAAVAATTGLIDMMTDRELEGVMAHEMAHVGNYDIKVSMIAFGLVAAISVLCDIGLRIAIRGAGDSDDDGAGVILLVVAIVAAVFGPIIAMMVQMAVSRNREYLADATAALTTRDPESLASALTKLSENKTILRNQNPSMANMYINNPLKKGWLSKMTSTHPPIEERIARLRQMAGQF